MPRPLRSVAAAALLLAGCGGGGAGNDAAANEADPGGRNAVAGDLARVEVRPGLWEVGSEVLAAAQPGLPAEFTDRMKGPRGSARHCITPEQAARPDGAFLAGRRSGQCSYQGFSMRDGRIAGTMTCRDPQGVETITRMNGTYGAEMFEMRMDIDTAGLGGGRLAVAVRQSGRRVDDCPKARGETKR